LQFYPTKPKIIWEKQTSYAPLKTAFLPLTHYWYIKHAQATAVLLHSTSVSTNLVTHHSLGRSTNGLH